MIFEAVEAFTAMTHEIRTLAELAEATDSEVHFPDFNPDLRGAKSPSLKDILLYLWHEDEGDGRSTLVFQGLVVAEKEVIEQVKRVNAAKDRFHKVMIAINSDRKDSLHEARQAINQRAALDRSWLKYTGLARLNLNHCYRTIPYHDAAILKVGFSWSKGELSITRMTPEQAVKRLYDLNKATPEHIAVQIEKASALPPNARLATIQVNNERLKANIVQEVLNEFGEIEIARKTIRTSLPLFVRRGKSKPDILFRPKPEQKVERLSRLDKKIDDEVFLPSLRAHLYRN